MAHSAAISGIVDTLAAIWAEELGVVDLDMDANFYDLGGSSLISMRIVARAKEAGITLRARQIFLHPTLRGLTAALTEAGR